MSPDVRRVAIVGNDDSDRPHVSKFLAGDAGTRERPWSLDIVDVVRSAVSPFQIVQDVCHAHALTICIAADTPVPRQMRDAILPLKLWHIIGYRALVLLVTRMEAVAFEKQAFEATIAAVTQWLKTSRYEFSLHAVPVSLVDDSGDGQQGNPLTRCHARLSWSGTQSVLREIEHAAEAAEGTSIARMTPKAIFELEHGAVVTLPDVEIVESREILVLPHRVTGLLQPGSEVKHAGAPILSVPDNPRLKLPIVLCDGNAPLPTETREFEALIYCNAPLREDMPLGLQHELGRVQATITRSHSLLPVSSWRLFRVTVRTAARVMVDSVRRRSSLSIFEVRSSVAHDAALLGTGIVLGAEGQERVAEAFADYDFSHTQSAAAKGSALERLTEALFLAARFELDADRHLPAEQYDLAVINHVKEGILGSLGPQLLVECKNIGEPAGATFMYKLVGQMLLSGIYGGVLVCPNGITGAKRGKSDATLLQREARGRGLWIAVIDSKDLEILRNGQKTLVEVLEAAYRRIKR